MPKLLTSYNCMRETSPSKLGTNPKRTWCSESWEAIPLVIRTRRHQFTLNAWQSNIVIDQHSEFVISFSQTQASKNTEDQKVSNEVRWHYAFHLTEFNIQKDPSWQSRHFLHSLIGSWSSSNDGLGKIWATKAHFIHHNYSSLVPVHWKPVYMMKLVYES